MKNRYLILIFLLIVAVGPAASADPIEWTLEPHRSIVGATPQNLGEPTPDLAMIVDDGTAEGDFGVNGTEAFQFLWLNHLTPPEPMFLEQIHVLFPADPNINPGEPIDLVVYRDNDGDPTTGAELLAVFPELVQITDGVSFSVYPIVLDEVFQPSDGVYLGVIPRFIESGVTAPTNPAALDSTAPQGRSWLATWQGDPPASPTLPSDNLVLNIDTLSPGNWLIRGFGSQAPVVVVPTAAGLGLSVTALLLMIAAVITLRRR